MSRDHAIYCAKCESWWSPLDFDACPCSEKGEGPPPVESDPSEPKSLIRTPCEVTSLAQEVLAL